MLGSVFSSPESLNDRNVPQCLRPSDGDSVVVNVPISLSHALCYQHWDLCEEGINEGNGTMHRLTLHSTAIATEELAILSKSAREVREKDESQSR